MKRHMQMTSGVSRVAVACLACFALAGLGGRTMASWTTGTGLEGVTIATGNLTATTGEVAWADVSTDALKSDPERLINDISSFRIVRGDTVRAVVPLTITGEGKNLAATVSVTPPGGSYSLNGESFSCLSGAFGVFSDGGTGSSSILSMKPGDGTPIGATPPPMRFDGSSSHTYNLVVDTTFDCDDEAAKIALRNLTLEVKQVRP